MNLSFSHNKETAELLKRAHNASQSLIIDKPFPADL